MKVVMASDAIAKVGRTTGDVIQMERLVDSLLVNGADAELLYTVGGGHEAIRCTDADCNDDCYFCDKVDKTDYHRKHAEFAMSHDADIYHVRAEVLMAHFPKDAHKVLMIHTPSDALGVLPKYISKFIMREADAVTCLSPVTKALLKSDYGIESTVIPPTINMDEFSPDVATHKIFESIHSDHILGYVGGLQDYQSPELIPVVLNKLKRTFPDVHMVMVVSRWPVGGKEKFLNLCRAMGVHDSMTILENVPNKDIASIISGCGIMYHIRNTDVRGDMLPLKTLEALSMEKPFVYLESDIGVESVYSDTHLQASSDPKDIADVFVNLFESDYKPTGMRDAVKNGGFSHIDVGKKLLEIYEVVLNG